MGVAVLLYTCIVLLWPSGLSIVVAYSFGLPLWWHSRGPRRMQSVMLFLRLSRSGLYCKESEQWFLLCDVSEMSVFC